MKVVLWIAGVTSFCKNDAKGPPGRLDLNRPETTLIRQLTDARSLAANDSCPGQDSLATGDDIRGNPMITRAPQDHQGQPYAALQFWEVADRGGFEPPTP